MTDKERFARNAKARVRYAADPVKGRQPSKKWQAKNQKRVKTAKREHLDAAKIRRQEERIDEYFTRKAGAW